MKKAYYRSSCSTCNRILQSISTNGMELQDIKKEPMTSAQLQQMANLAGSYEALFSRRAQKYKEMGLKEKVLTEQDYESLILQHYTFLKRPVFILEDTIYVGNSKKVVEQVQKCLL